MLALAKNSDDVNSLVIKAVIPIILVPLAVMLLMIFITCSYSKNLIKDIRGVEDYMKEVAGHNFNAQLLQSVYNRNDELYEIGKSATEMKNSLRKLVEQDDLTGLHNRRFGETRFKNVWHKAEELKKPFSIVMCDIDFFKKVNDTYGHEAGDEVLKIVAGILKEGTADNGFAIRWGGEEFLLCFTNFDVEKTKERLEEVLNRIRSTVVRYGDFDISVTMTFGIVKGDTGKSVDELIKIADNKLYEGKQSGRNRIIV